MEDDNHVASPESDSVAACRGSLRVETLNPVNILMLMLCLYSRSPSEVMMLTLQPSSTAQRRVLPRPSPFPCKGSRHESDLRVVSRTQPQFLCSTVHTLKGTPALFTSDTHLHHHTWLTAPCHVSLSSLSCHVCLSCSPCHVSPVAARVLVARHLHAEAVVHGLAPHVGRFYPVPPVVVVLTGIITSQPGLDSMI